MVVGTKLVEKGDGKRISVQGTLRVKMLINEDIRHQSLIDKIITKDRQFSMTQTAMHNNSTLDERKF